MVQRTSNKAIQNQKIKRQMKTKLEKIAGWEKRNDERNSQGPKTNANTKQQRIKEWELKVKKIVAHYKKLDALMNKLNELGMCDTSPNGLHETVFGTVEELLEMIDVAGWLSWYIHDNECGQRARPAGYDGKSKPIRTERDIAKLIVESEDRN